MKYEKSVRNALIIRGEVLEALEELEYKVKRNYGLNGATARKLLRSASREAYGKKGMSFPHYF